MISDITLLGSYFLWGLGAKFYSQTGLSMARVLVYGGLYREKRAKDFGPCVDSNSQTSVPQRSALPMMPRTNKALRNMVY